MNLTTAFVGFVAGSPSETTRCWSPERLKSGACAFQRWVRMHFKSILKLFPMAQHLRLLVSRVFLPLTKATRSYQAAIRTCILAVPWLGNWWHYKYNPVWSSFMTLCWVYRSSGRQDGTRQGIILKRTVYSREDAKYCKALKKTTAVWKKYIYMWKHISPVVLAVYHSDTNWRQNWGSGLNWIVWERTPPDGSILSLLPCLHNSTWPSY